MKMLNLKSVLMFSNKNDLVEFAKANINSS